jgi:hypothetical protein
MRKIIIFFIVLVLFISVYCARGILLAPYLERYITAKTDHDISISNFSLSPFKLSLKNVNVDGFIRIHNTTAKINLFKLLFNISSPLECIKQVEFSNIEIDLKESQTTPNLNQSGNRNKAILKLPQMDINVYINEILIKQEENLSNISDANVHINENTIKANLNLHVAGNSANVEAVLKQRSDYLFDGSVVLTSKNRINMYITSEGTIDLLSLNSDWKIAVVNLGYRWFDFGGASGTLLKNEKGINIKVVGNFGKFEVEGFLSDLANASAFIDLSKTSKSVSGKLDMNFKKQKDLNELNLKASNLKVFNFDLGKFELFSTKNKSGTYQISCDYGLKRRFEAIYLQDGNYEGDLIIRDKKVGYIKGNIKTREISVDAKNIDIQDIPVIPFMLESASGKVNISGSIDRVSGKIDLIFNNLKTPNMNSIDAKGTVIRDRSKFTFDFYKSDESFLLRHVVSGGNIVYTDCKFKDVNISDVFKIIGRSRINLSGISNGNIRYEKGTGVRINIKSYDGIFYGNNFKEFEVKGEVDLNKVNIERFIMTNVHNTNIIDIKGFIGFTDENQKSSIYINLRDTIIRGVKVNCNGAFQGYLKDNNLVKGVLNVSEANICSLIPLGNIKSDMNISPKKIELSNLKSDRGLTASLSINLDGNEIAGTADFKNTNLEGIYPGFTGILDASVKISGKLNNPYIEMSAMLKKGVYLSQPLSLSAKISYKDRVVSVSKIDVLSDKTKIAIKGEYSRLGRLQLSINNLNESIINVLAGVELPFKGEFSGGGEIRFSGRKQKFDIYLGAKNAYVGSLKLNDLKTEIEIEEKTINLKSAFAKISNSEIRIDKGFYNLNNNKYFLDLFLLNIHAGPVNLFGNIKISGGGLKDSGSFIYSGTVDLNNLWLNHYRLNHCLFNYSFKNGSLKFFKNPSNEDNDINISSEITFSDTLSVKKLNIAKKLSYFDMSGNFSKDYVNFEAKSSDIDLKFLANLFNFSTGLEGSANISAKLIGNLDDLKGSISANSSNGILMKVPFDKLNIYIDFYNSRAYIKEAYITKRNGINIELKGSLPIKSKELIDITYKLEDNKLSIINYFLDNFLIPLNGKLLLNGHIGGSYKNLKNNTTLSIYNGMFKPNDYFNKIKNLSVEMSLNADNLIKINKFTFSSGAGKVNIEGKINLEKDFDIRVATEGKRGIPISVPQLSISKFIGSTYVLKDFSSGEPLFDVKISGTFKEPLVSGYVILENTKFTFPGKRNEKISDFSLPENTKFDLDFRTGTNTRFENSAISAFINGSLHIDGTVNKLHSRGIIELTKGKVDTILGKTFDIVSSKVEIVDEAIDTDTANNKVYVTLEGENVSPSKTGRTPETMKLLVERTEISKLSDKINFISKDDPNMDSQEAWNRAMNRYKDKETASSFESSPDFVVKQQALRQLFDQRLSSPLARSLLRKIGIVDDFRISYVDTDDTLSVDKDFGLVNLLSGTRYTFEKSISKDIVLGYNVTLDEFNKKLDLRHGVELQYRLMPNLFLQGSYERSGEIGSNNEASLILRHQFKFGPSKKHKK